MRERRSSYQLNVMLQHCELQSTASGTCRRVPEQSNSWTRGGYEHPNETSLEFITKGNIDSDGELVLGQPPEIFYVASGQLERDYSKKNDNPSQPKQRINYKMYMYYLEKVQELERMTSEYRKRLIQHRK